MTGAEFRNTLWGHGMEARICGDEWLEIWEVHFNRVAISTECGDVFAADIKEVRFAPYPYTFTWKNNPVRAAWHGRRCRILASGKMNTVSIEFENGERTTTSRRALRKQEKQCHH